MKRLCAVVAGVFSLAACATADIEVREAGVQPLADTDEAGLWMTMTRAEDGLRHSPNLNSEANLNAYVQDVVCRVSAEYCSDIRVYVVDQPYFNATMAPNGMMQVWSGLLLRAENEAQLAFVVGHETAHYVENHSLEAWRTAKNSSAAATVFSMGAAAAGAPALGAAGSLVALGTIYGFSRENEREADRLGLERAVAAGYDPSQAAAIWRLLVEERQNSDDEEVRKTRARGGVFNTHPLTSERIAALEAQAAGRRTGTRGDDRHADMVSSHLDAWLDADLRRRDFGQTLFLLERLSARQRDLGVLSYYEGEVYRRRAEAGDAARAREAYQRAVAHAGAPAQAFRQLGEIARSEGRLADAIMHYEIYLEHAPDAADRAFVERYLRDMRGEL